LRRGPYSGLRLNVSVFGELNPHGGGSVREGILPHVVGGDMAAYSAAVRGGEAP